MNIIQNTVSLAMHIVKGYVKEGDTVIDATCGNGADTAALAEITGESGLVISFDIQKSAIERAKEKIGSGRVRFINDGHEHMDEYVSGEVSAVIFNLGYLPGGDKSVTTMTDTTLEALDKACRVIKKDGVVSVTVYPGHEEGKREKEAVLDWASRLDKKVYHCAYISMINQSDSAPEIVMISKKQTL